MATNIKNLLITGHTGFIGRHLADYLANFHPEVNIRGFSRSTGGDVRNFDHIFSAMQGMELVINLAGSSNFEKSWKNPRETVELDALGATNVLRSAKESDTPVIHISSAEAYGTNLHPGRPMPEDHPLHPRHPYGVAKKAADVVAQNLINEGHPVVVLRPFTQYGNGAEERIERFIPGLVRRALLGRDIPLVGDGEIKRDWVFVGDTAEAIWETRNARPGVYNICTGLSYSQNQVATAVLHEVKKLIHTKSVIVSLPPRFNPNEVKEHHGDPTKFFEETGWKAKTTLEDGIKKCVEFYKK